MRLNVRIFDANGEYVLEDLDNNTVRVFSRIEDLLDHLKAMVTASRRSESKSNLVSTGSWYIRFPIIRILDILRFAYRTKIVELNALLAQYLESHGLSRSNARVLSPTFTSLGLHVNGRLQDSALKIGEHLERGQISEAARILYALSLNNGVLREILRSVFYLEESKLQSQIKDVLSRFNMCRKDEILYTTQLIKFLIDNCVECRCQIVQNQLRGYLSGESKELEIDKYVSCDREVTMCLLEHVLAHRRRDVAEILERLSATSTLDVVNMGSEVCLKDRMLNRCVAKVVHSIVIAEGDGYVATVRQTLDRLNDAFRGEALFKNLNYVIAIPIFVRGREVKVKLCLRLVINGVADVTKVIDIP